MTSATTGLICAIVVGIIAVVLIAFQVRRNLMAKKAAKQQPVEQANGSDDHSAPPVTAATSGDTAQLTDEMSPTASQAIPVRPEIQDDPDQEEAETYSTSILSKDIISELKVMAEPQAEAAKQKYLGQKVEWVLYFSSMMMKSGTSVEVSLLNENDTYPMVSFLVDLGQHPEVGKLRQGMPVTIKGEIAQIFTSYIVLKEVEFSSGEIQNP